jgi:hypothetical protein
VSRYEFNPATLMQRRPSRDDADPIRDGVQHLDHERAHWSQFAGTTFGSLYMTLLRAEEFELLEAARSCVAPDGNRPLADAIRSGTPLLIATDGHPSRRPSSAVGPIGGEALATYLRLRNVRSMLLHGPPADGGHLRDEDLAGVLAIVEDVYARHTGKVRPWWVRGQRQSWIEIVPNPDTGVVAPNGLTTCHLLEAHARLNEWGIAINQAWRHDDNTSFEGLADRVLQIDGDLQASAMLYRWAIDLALEAWRPHFDALAGLCASDCISRCAMSLVACLDLALNPHVPPICAPQPLAWSDLYPPDRFVRAVAAVRLSGLLDSWLSNADYLGHRSEIASAASLVYGVLEERSFQNQVFTEEYFASAEIGDSTLERMSYFDYYVFASERLLELRREFPLTVAWPWLFNFRGSSR